MNFVNSLMIGNGRDTERKNLLWNMVGSAVYAIASMLLGAAVTRIMGADQGGIFFFAFSTLGQQLFILAYFGMRPIQVTDTASRHSFGDYRQLRFYTCAAAVLAAVIYCLFEKNPVKRIVIFFMVLYKVTDGFADCWESEYQRDGRLYMTGKSNTFRTLLSVTVFLGVLWNTRNLIMASAAAVGAQLLGLYLFCLSPIRALPEVDYTVHPGCIRELFSESKWLFISTFLDLYIFAASKYAVDQSLTAAESGYYSTIFIPTSVINLMAGFIIRPVLTRLSADWEKGDLASLKRTVRRILFLIAGLTVLGMAAAALFGIPVLAAFLGKSAGKNLYPYRGALITVILGGGFYAVLNLLYYVLVILREQKPIFFCYGICTVLAFAVSGVLVKRYGINGGALSYLILMIVLAGMFAFTAYRKLAKRENHAG